MITKSNVKNLVLSLGLSSSIVLMFVLLTQKYQIPVSLFFLSQQLAVLTLWYFLVLSTSDSQTKMGRLFKATSVVLVACFALGGIALAVQNAADSGPSNHPGVVADPSLLIFSILAGFTWLLLALHKGIRTVRNLVKALGVAGRKTNSAKTVQQDHPKDASDPPPPPEGVEPEERFKLNLACGKMYLEGYVNIDSKQMYDGEMRVDIQDDILTMTWPEGSVDEILLSHFAMYIDMPTMEALLRRWRSWLAPGGRLIIETGNVKAVAAMILASSDPDEINGGNGIRQLYGWETTAGHRWAWCPETLGDLMKKTGYVDLEIGPGVYHSNPVRDFLIMGTK